MIDLHSHYIYGVDDGARNLDMSLEMLIQAETIGISRLLATPHLNERTPAKIISAIHETFRSTQQVVTDHQITLNLKLSAEVNIISASPFWKDHPWVIFGEDRRYMLIETPFEKPPSNYADFLFQLRVDKVAPVMAHPERNVYYQKKPQLLIDLLNQGCLAQADAGSITGQFGKRCQRFVMRLLNAGAIHFVASDAHESKWRNYRVLSDACHIIENTFSIDYAKKLTEDNPLRCWQGQLVETKTLSDDALDGALMDRLKNWF